MPSSERLRRLLLFPLVLLYVAALVSSAWPRLLTPQGTPTAIQLWGLAVLHTLGVYAGQEVFGGQGLITEYPRHTCLQIAAQTPTGQQLMLYDDFDECADDRYDWSKSSLGLLYKGVLIQAIDQAHRPEPGDMSTYPLSYLLAISEHYCSGEPRGPFTSLAIRHRVQTTQVVNGQLLDRLYFSGSRTCANHEWHLAPLPGWESWAANR